MVDVSSDRAFGKYLKEFMVKPLSQGSIFSCELNDFLSDDTSPEWVAGWNLSLSKVRNIFDEFIINTFNFEIFTFNFHFSIEMFFNQSFELVGIISIQSTRDSVMLALES